MDGPDCLGRAAVSRSALDDTFEPCSDETRRAAVRSDIPGMMTQMAHVSEVRLQTHSSWKNLLADAERRSSGRFGTLWKAA